MDGCIESPSLEALNLGIVLFNPISSVPGSASLFYLQPLLTGKVFASAGVLIGAQLFLFLAQRIFGLEGVKAMRKDGQGQVSSVEMTMSELQALLRSVAKGSSPNGSSGQGQALGSPYGSNLSPVQEQFATPTTPEAPLIIALAVYGDFSSQPFSPLIFVTLPILTLPGVRGSLPLLILTTLSTIFIRAVVPPSTTGSRPLLERSADPAPIQLRPDELIALLKRFSKYFKDAN